MEKWNFWWKLHFWPTWSWDRALAHSSKRMRKVHLSLDGQNSKFHTFYSKFVMNFLFHNFFLYPNLKSAALKELLLAKNCKFEKKAWSFKILAIQYPNNWTLCIFLDECAKALSKLQVGQKHNFCRKFPFFHACLWF